MVFVLAEDADCHPAGLQLMLGIGHRACRTASGGPVLHLVVDDGSFAGSFRLAPRYDDLAVARRRLDDRRFGRLAEGFDRDGEIAGARGVVGGGLRRVRPGRGDVYDPGVPQAERRVVAVVVVRQLRTVDVLAVHQEEIRVLSADQFDRELRGGGQLEGEELGVFSGAVRGEAVGGPFAVRGRGAFGMVPRLWMAHSLVKVEAEKSPDQVPRRCFGRTLPMIAVAGQTVVVSIRVNNLRINLRFYEPRSPATYGCYTLRSATAEMFRKLLTVDGRNCLRIV